MSKALDEYAAAIECANAIGRRAGGLESWHVINNYRTQLTVAMRALRREIAEEPRADLRMSDRELLATLKRLHYAMLVQEACATREAGDRN
jgi:microcompartment protein CcmL/EutN